MMARDRHRVPARRGAGRVGAAARRVVRPRRLRRTARRSGPTRASGSPRRRACCALVAGMLFLTTSSLAHLCTPEEDEAPITNRLVRPLFAPWQVEWPGYQGVEYHLSHGDWIRVLRENGFVLDALHELQAGRRCEDARVLLRDPRRLGPALAWRGSLGGASPMSKRRLDRREHRGVDGDERAAHRRERAARVGSRRDPLGRVRDPRGAGRRAPGRERPRRRRARLRHRVLRLVARAPWRARRRRRPDACAARDRASDDGADGLEFPLVEAPGESVPLPDASFDLAVSEYGASLWADPRKWISEAARLLRPGGRLVFLTNSTLVYLCAPTDVDSMVGEELMRDQFGMYRIQWDGAIGIEYHLSHGELDRAPARARLRGRGAARAAAARDRRRPELLRLRHRRVGEEAGPPRRSG